VISINGKLYQQRSVKEKAITGLWQALGIVSGQNPASVMFEHFSQSESD